MNANQLAAIKTASDRVVAALEYLAHEVDPIRAITLAEAQLRRAKFSLAAANGEMPARRQDDPPLTFDRAERVPRNPWPPAAASDPKGGDLS